MRKHLRLMRQRKRLSRMRRLGLRMLHQQMCL